MDTKNVKNAKYIWSGCDSGGRNRFVMFRRSFVLDAAGAAGFSGTVNIFADTRYRLMVNGFIVAHGPCRFFTDYPPFDSHDVGEYLREGENVIAVIVNSYAGGTFHSEKSIGGLIAWSEFSSSDGGTQEIFTDEVWLAMDCPHYRSDTPYMSFALNPGELQDSRDEPAGWAEPGFDDSHWQAAVEITDSGHWGELRPRPIPLLDERTVQPRDIIGVWSARAQDGETLYSMKVAQSDGYAEPMTQAKILLMTFIHSPKKQEITFGAWWGKYWINGKECSGSPRAGVHLRQDFTVTLEEGWNTLEVYETCRGDSWYFYLALPDAADLHVSAEKEIDSANTFCIGGPWIGEKLSSAEQMQLPLAGVDDLPGELGPWRCWQRGKTAENPCRERAWKKFEKLSSHCGGFADLKSISKKASGDSLCVLFDFGTEVIGRPVLDFISKSGTTVDISYCERLDDDGLANIHASYFVELSERFITRGGHQNWTTFHPRGFKYLEVLVTGNIDDFELLNVGLSRSNYQAAHAGNFTCSDPRLNEIWRLGARTLHACMEDAYLDCPWRERGLYAGDLLVQFLVSRAVTGDMKLMRRSLELFLQGQGENGLCRPGAHGLPAGRHPDYSAIIPQAMYRYWSASGDDEFLREYEPNLLKLLAGMESLKIDGADLVDGGDLTPYIDLGSVEREGVTCALNCFFEAGFRDGAKILEILSRDEKSRYYSELADRLAAAIRDGFWSEKFGVFVDKRKIDNPDSKPSVHANTLTLLYNIADDDQKSGALSTMAELMENNSRDAEPTQRNQFNVMPYFSFYAMEVLFDNRKAGDAIRFMRKHWSRMLDCGAWTCWEFFIDSASRCHAWSASPTHFLSEKVLGVTFPTPGNPDRIHINPIPGNLQWAEGVYPHGAGDIEISWIRKAGKIIVKIDAPKQVEISFADSVSVGGAGPARKNTT